MLSFIIPPMSFVYQRIAYCYDEDMNTRRDLTLREVTIWTIYKRLKKFEFVRAHAAASLGVTERTVRQYIEIMQKMGLVVPESPLAPGVKLKESEPSSTIH